MRLIVSGSRNTGHREAVQQVKAGYASYLKLFPAATVLLQGGAKGIDTGAKAYFSNLGIPVEDYPADWNKYGNSAGPRRNRQMAEWGNVLLAIWDGESRGTKSMINEARAKQLPVVVTRPDSTGEIWLSYGIDPARICKYNNWGPETILDYQGDLFKITKVDETDAWGYRANRGVDTFGTSEQWLPIDWSMVDITNLIGEG
jgi:hypothetical protein